MVGLSGVHSHTHVVPEFDKLQWDHMENYAVQPSTYNSE